MNKINENDSFYPIHETMRGMICKLAKKRDGEENSCIETNLWYD